MIRDAQKSNTVQRWDYIEHIKQTSKDPARPVKICLGTTLPKINKKSFPKSANKVDKANGFQDNGNNSNPNHPNNNNNNNNKHYVQHHQSHLNQLQHHINKKCNNPYFPFNSVQIIGSPVWQSPTTTPTKNQAGRNNVTNFYKPTTSPSPLQAPYHLRTQSHGHLYYNATTKRNKLSQNRHQYDGNSPVNNINQVVHNSRTAT